MPDERPELAQILVPPDRPWQRFRLAAFAADDGRAAASSLLASVCLAEADYFAAPGQALPFRRHESPGALWPGFAAVRSVPVSRGHP